MNKKDIEIQYKKKINLISNYNKFYYEKSEPRVSDKEYDDLKAEILLLESNYKFLNSKNSPSNNVGYKPSKNFKKKNTQGANAFIVKCLWKRRFDQL